MVFHRGSILDPLLFIILDGDLFYINDSLDCARHADATTTCVSGFNSKFKSIS